MGAGAGVGTTGSGLNCGLVIEGRGVGRVAVDCLTLRYLGQTLGRILQTKNCRGETETLLIQIN